MSALTTPGAAEAKPRSGRRFYTTQEFILLMLLILEIAVFVAAVPAARQSRVYFDLLRELSPNLIAVVGIALLMIGGDFDLTPGAVMAATGVVAVTVMNLTGSLAIGVVAGLLVGPVIGLILGYLITRQKMSSLMTSLGMMFALRGAVYVSTNKQAVTPTVAESTQNAFIAIFQGSLGPVPIPAILAFVIVGVWIFISTQTEFGRRIFAVGGNAQAARVSGIKVERMKMLLFVLAGITSAIAGILMASNVGAGYYDAGLGFELILVTAVVLGGVSLNGGEGSLWGAILGVLILGVSSKAMRMMSVVTTTQLVVTGVIMMLAVYLHGLRKQLLQRKQL